MVKLGFNKIFAINFEFKHDFNEQVGRASYIGLVNEGTTCYLNSLVQTLFFIKEFRSAIFQVEADSENKQICFNLQRIFFNLNP